MILALDSTDRGGSVALAADGDVVDLRYEHSNRTHSVRLMPVIEQILRDHDTDYEQLSGMAVATGPGSFTAIRLAVTTAKTLAEVCDIPLVAPSSLRLLAEFGHGHEGVIRTAIDARRGELYVQDYSGGKPIEPEGEPSLVEPEAFRDSTDAFSHPLIVARGRNWSPDELPWPEHARVFPDTLARPLALPLYNVARRRLRDGNEDDRKRVTPNYVRDSDARRSAKRETSP